MSKLSGTVTSTPEEKWGLMADGADAEVAEADTPTLGVDISKKVEKSDATQTGATQTGATQTGATQADAEKADAEKADAEKAAVGKVAVGTADVEEGNSESATRTRSGKGAATDRRSWRTVFTIRRISVGALAVIAIAAIVVAAILGWKLNEQNNIDAAADEAQAAAERYAVTLTSVSSDSLDQNFAAVLDGATGEFKDMYSQSSGQLRDLLVENKANAQGTVIDSGVKSATTSKVEVMLFVDQSVTNTATPDARIDRSRVLMTMEKIDGRWLASKVDLP